ncbi:MAG: CheR family methyltransferase [Thiotrichales bacterium]
MSAREFAYTDDDFQRIREFVYSQTGISLSEGKREMVYSRLSRRLRQLGMRSFSEYRGYFERDRGEIEHLTNAITTNLTAFFREQHHFDYLGKQLLPILLKRNAGTRRLRFWSAGCSTGEEVYSIALTVKAHLASADNWDVKILATDLDSNVLETASHGIYPIDRIERLPADWIRMGFLKGSGANQGNIKVTEELRGMVEFRQLNLIKDWPALGEFDVIFCRNVVIYFDKATQMKLFDRFANALTEGGHLFIGHSETLSNLTDRYSSLGKTIYQKIR